MGVDLHARPHESRQKSQDLLAPIYLNPTSTDLTEGGNPGLSGATLNPRFVAVVICDSDG